MRRRLLFAALVCAVWFTGAPAAQQPPQQPSSSPSPSSAPVASSPQQPAASSQTGQPGQPTPTGQAGQAAQPGQQPAAQQPGQQPAPTPAPTFKIDVNYVEVDATVTDEKGNFVKGLTKEDFEVLEDGKPQKIDLFSQVDIPVEAHERTLAGGKPIVPDVASNDKPANGRLYVIVLDDLHTDALRSSLVKRAARMFIENNFAANDTAAIVYTSGRADVSQEFTSSPQLLLNAIDKFMGRKLRSVTLEKLDSYNRQQAMDAGANSDGSSSGSSSSSSSSLSNAAGSNGDSLDFERGYYARMALTSLRNLANYMTNIRGRRKAVLYFSEGINYPIYDIFTARDATTIVQETRDAITAAARGNVSFFTIDPRGLVGLPDENMELTNMPEDNNLRLNTQGLMDELRLSQDSLRTLAEETGGLAVVNQNDFKTAYDKIVQANSAYYLIGYYPQENRRDGRFHKLSVKVNKPGMRVTARKGYSIPKVKQEDTREKGGDAQTSKELRDVLNSPLQQSGLTMTVHAAAFRGTGKNASVALAIEMSGDKLNFKHENNLFLDKVELSFYAFNQDGKAVPGTRSEFDLKLRPQTRQFVQAFGFRANPRLDLPPGRYQLRVGVREANGGELGSVFTDVEVPDFSKQKLTMSNILVTAATAQVTITPMPDKQLQNILPAPAMARREFVQGDMLAAYAEIYDNMPPSPSHTVDITTQVTTLDGREVFKASEERVSTELQQGASAAGAKAGAGGGYGHLTQIPTKDIAPGRYLLRVEAKGRMKDVPVAARELPITILAPRVPQPAQQGSPTTTKKPDGGSE